MYEYAPLNLLSLPQLVDRVHSAVGVWQVHLSVLEGAVSTVAAGVPAAATSPLPSLQTGHMPLKSKPNIFNARSDAYETSTALAFLLLRVLRADVPWLLQYFP